MEIYFGKKKSALRRWGVRTGAATAQHSIVPSVQFSSIGTPNIPAKGGRSLLELGTHGHDTLVRHLCNLGTHLSVTPHHTTRRILMKKKKHPTHFCAVHSKKNKTVGCFHTSGGPHLEDASGLTVHELKYSYPTEKVRVGFRSLCASLGR